MKSITTDRQPLVLEVEEHGYRMAAIGFSFSFNTSTERAMELMPTYAWGKRNSERKFLRAMSTWCIVRLPRLQWAEADQYKIGTTTLSESTVHTIKRRLLDKSDFIPETRQRAIDLVNECILEYREKKITLLELKANLPEGFLQSRVWVANYAVLQNYCNERQGHPILIWDHLIQQTLPRLEHPDFIVRDYSRNLHSV